MYFIWILITCLFVQGSVAQTNETETEGDQNGCSYHKYATCHERADCVDLNKQENLWECRCPEYLIGDALKNGTGCGEPTCRLSSECHSLAVCEGMTCVCKAGYTGDGWNDCTDVNECVENPCHRYATCENNEGSFTCTCNMQQGYVGDGFTCKRQCSITPDCTVNGQNEVCVNKQCVCAPGFSDVIGLCEDINECVEANPCSEHATCNNTIGSVTCSCINGYFGTGFTCALMPQHCHDVKLQKPNAKSGSYEIDPDGTGPLLPVMVVCEMRPGYGITILPTQRDRTKKFTSDSTDFVYDYQHTLSEIFAIIENSAFCYQSMLYDGFDGAVLLDGDDYWKDGNGNRQYTWGGATERGKCACGQMGYCEDPGTNCNNNGEVIRRQDSGKIIDKSLLPITRVVTDPGPSPARAFVKIDPVMCAPFPFDIPLTCNDAKFNPLYKVTDDGPQLIDLDGPTGPLDPVLVHCDMETYNDVGVTVVPTNRREMGNVTDPGTNEISYAISDNALETLLRTSEFCRQEAGFRCMNSRLLNNGDKKGWFTDLRGNEKDYFPGGMGEYGKCACAITGTCASDNYGCNCDVNDGETRIDYGVVYDKADLPIGSITFTEIGENRFGSFYVGPLMCAGGQFGFAPTCQDYAYAGYEDNQTLIIDPDGPEGEQPPFPVYCEFVSETKVGNTIVFPENDGYEVSRTGVYEYTYIRVTQQQLIALTTRAVTCFQEVTYSCNGAPIHSSSGAAYVSWQTPDGRSVTYFAGTGEENVCTCGLTDPSSCAGSKACNCDAGGSRQDIGVLIQKGDLPMMSTTFSQITGSATITVGPLQCKEVYPNCAELRVANKQNRLSSENLLDNGFYSIDPDGVGGVEAFTVECINTKTVISIDIEPALPTSGSPDEGVSNCYDINYKSDGKPVTPDQVQALVDNSAFCAQQLSQDCQNAPLIGHSNFTTCDGEAQIGWAGGKDSGKCACGVTGTCAGGPEDPCNCELVDGQMRTDGGWMLDSNRLAVCQVCVSLNPTSELPPNVEKVRRVMPFVSDLFCDIAPVGKGKNCQDWRNQGMTEAGTQMLDPDDSGAVEPFPIYCGMQVYPPLGWTEIHPKKPEIEVPPEGIDITIEYYVYSVEYVRTLISVSGYCTQELWLECENARLEITGSYGWYSKDGIVQNYWAGNKQASFGCSGGECNCNGTGIASDGGLILDKYLLPLSQIVLGPSDGFRTLKVGPVKCFDLPRDCEEIRQTRQMKNPLGNHTYTIDPDQAGGVDYFPVTCDFKTNRRIGITEVPVVPPEDRSVTNKSQPGGYHVLLNYFNVNYNQINALAKISGFCMQNIEYVCYQSPLINSNNPSLSYYLTYGGEQSPSYGIAGHPDMVGCACMATKSCPAGYSCHCDVIGPMTMEYGYETDKNSLPIQQLNFGGQANPRANAMFHISDVRCAPKPFSLPKHCQEAFDQGMRYSGEVLIWPNFRVEPFLVYCDMNRIPGKAVTIVGNDLEPGKDVVFGKKITVNYHDADQTQMQWLSRVSTFCYQPFRYECQNTKLLETNTYFYWKGGNYRYERYSVGAGIGQCNCGEQGYCGGSEDKETLLSITRKCNCDAADNELRADAGVYNASLRLPIYELFFNTTGIPQSYGHITLGKLYCAEEDFDLNECHMGFHDCHDQANCINKHGYFDCQCKHGWRGLGRENVLANGRNCYDDDECAMNLCPWSSDCYNTPGSFQCVCKEGFTQTGKRSCQDIDECALGTHNCHENARCINLIGSYDCRCNRNYVGNGISCEPQALCACFGDPHCLSYDGRLVTYQGECLYTMSRDNCGGEPTFELLSTFSAQDGVSTKEDVSWVKELTFNIYNYSIALLQNYEVQVNGYRVQLPYRRSDLNIRLYGKFVEVFTQLGVEVRWDGIDTAEIRTPGSFKEQMCGLCGNYNDYPADDLTIGPACPNLEGTLTDQAKLFGNSWLVESFVEIEPTCVAKCNETDEPDVCKGLDFNIAELLCLKIWDINGQFKDCLTIMDDSIREVYFSSCVYDMCRVDGDASIVICHSAESLVEECSTSYGVELTSFRSTDFCQISCGENMEYNICGPSNQMTCYDYVLNLTPEINNETCVEGCFCKDGYVFDNNKCVDPGQCGCIYEDNYIEVDTEITLNNCGQVVVCLPDNKLNYTGIECHEDATCKLKRGRYGCHCNEGFYGNGVTHCHKDKCLDEPCGTNETCLRDVQSPEGYKCVCAMGFMGDCGNCQEIDECLTNTHDCPQSGQCINTVGSFRCECYEGYTFFYDKCIDVDECQLEELGGAPLCGENSRCSNTIGGYECPCCSGFVRNSTGDCVEASGGGESAEGPRCCVCNIAICDKPGTVCGEDGVQYDSIRDMIISNCEKGLPPNKQINVDYYGPCKSTCSADLCPEYQVCLTDERSGKPTCECESCTQEETVSEPVCTDKLDVYPNMCVFKKVQCMLDTEAKPLPDMQPCEEKNGGGPMGPWSEWGSCSETCGKGTSTRTRQPSRELTPEEAASYPLEQTTECYTDPCPGEACFGYECGNVAAECVVVDDEPVCECPQCTNIGVDPVCGYVSGKTGEVSPGTWQSECHLKKFVCEKDVYDYELMHDGACGEIPKDCTRVPHSMYIRGGANNEYSSAKKVNVFDCQGGCGVIKDDCCQPAESESVSVRLYNLDNQYMDVNVTVIRGCECVDIDEIP